MRKAFILFLLVLIAGVFVSCNLDELFYREESATSESDDAAPAASDEVGDLTIYEGLAEDTKAAVDEIGEIALMLAPDSENGSRFINGQILTENFKDENGNPVPLIFNSWLVGYKSLFGWVPQIFEKAPVNAMFHNNHGYNLKNLPKGLTYLEFSEYRYLETNEYHKAGEVCFIGLRLLCGEVSSRNYYCKALRFDPTLRYELSTFGLDLLTGKYVTYNCNTKEVGPASHIRVYDDDGVLVETDYIDEEGNSTGKTVYEYNSDGFKTKQTYYDASGMKFSESYFPGSFKGNEQYSLFFDENGSACLKIVPQYAQDGKTIIREVAFDLSDLQNRLTYEIYYPKKNGSEFVRIDYDKIGNPESMREIIGGKMKSIEFYPSGHPKQVNAYVGDWNLVSTELYDDGNVFRVEVASLEDSYESETEISFTTANPEYSLFIPVHLDLGVDPNNLVIEMLVVDEDGNEIELDSSEYSIKFFGDDETVDIEEGSLVYRVPADKWIESINVTLEKNDDIEATLKIRVNNNVILMGVPDKFTKTITYDVPDVNDQSFFIDFSGAAPAPINVSTNEIFWYVVTKDDYSPDLDLFDAVLALDELVEISGVDASEDSETSFWPNGKGNAFNLVVETSGEGTADHDLAVYFIYAQYTGPGTKNVTQLSVSDVKELVRVPLVFYK